MTRYKGFQDKTFHLKLKKFPESVKMCFFPLQIRYNALIYKNCKKFFKKANLKGKFILAQQQKIEIYIAFHC